MSFINYATKDLICKIVYYGTGLSGKTTNVQFIYENTQTNDRGKLVTLSTENERTLFFDFLPLSAGSVSGYKTRFHIYTVPGQTFYEISRQFILKGVDGVVFVIDSAPERMESNFESFESFKKNLEVQGYDIARLPIVFQYNKRDIANAISLTELEAAFNPDGRPFVEAVANRGEGVMETLQVVSKQIVEGLRGEKRE